MRKENNSPQIFELFYWEASSKNIESGITLPHSKVVEIRNKLWTTYQHNEFAINMSHGIYHHWLIQGGVIYTPIERHSSLAKEKDYTKWPKLAPSFHIVGETLKVIKNLADLLELPFDKGKLRNHLGLPLK